MPEDTNKPLDEQPTPKAPAIRFRPWVVAACFLVGLALFYANVAGETRPRIDYWDREPYDFHVWGWPFIHATQDGLRPPDISLYLIVVNTVVSAIMLVATAVFLDCYVHRWIKDRQWTLADMLLLTTAMAPFLSLVVLDWEYSAYEEAGSFHHLWAFPIYVVLPVMAGIFCVAHAACSLVYYCLRTGWQAVRRT